MDLKAVAHHEQLNVWTVWSLWKKSYMWEQYVYMQVVQFIGQNVYSR